MGNNRNNPWIIAGDFNEITSNADKLGGPIRRQGLIAHFRGALDQCNLSEIPFVGGPFTWCNHRDDPHTIRCKLDRAFFNQAGRTFFPNAEVRVLRGHSLDHTPILLSAEPAPLRHHPSCRPRRFHFENWWLKEPLCSDLIAEAFAPNDNFGLVPALDKCRQLLLHWKQGSLRHLNAEIDRLKDCIHAYNTGSRTSLSAPDFKAAQMRLEFLLDNKESAWKQRAKTDWLREGDRNTSFFHAKAAARRRVNRIEKLLNESGDWCCSDAEIEGVIQRCFLQLYTFDSPTLQNMEVIWERLQPRVSDEMNRALLSPFSVEEVKTALFIFGLVLRQDRTGFLLTFSNKSGRNWEIFSPNGHWAFSMGDYLLSRLILLF